MALKDIVPGLAKRLAGSKAAAIAGGPVALHVSDLFSLSLIPYYCDPSVQFALILRAPKSAKLDRKALKMKFILVSEADGEIVISIPGDGIYPPQLLFTKVAAAIAQAAPPGTTIELRAANIGTVNRDWVVKSETASSAGDHRYSGTIGEHATLTIDASHPKVDAAALTAAVAIGRTVLSNGPWVARDRDEAAAVVRNMLDRRSANINEAFVRVAVRVEGGRIVTQPSFDQPPTKHFALGMELFRLRFANGPWDVKTVSAVDYYGMLTEAQKDEVMKAVLG
jgi:hypothetical protein